MNTEQDVFLITAEDMLRKSEKLADRAFKAYHSLKNQNTKYGDSIWSLFLLHNSISKEIRNRIERYKDGIR